MTWLGLSDSPEGHRSHLRGRTTVSGPLLLMELAGPACGAQVGGQAASFKSGAESRLAQESLPQLPPFCSQRSHSHNHLLLILSATSIKLFVETN